MEPVATICPKCGNFHFISDAVCIYCGYVGVVPMEQEEEDHYYKITLLYREGVPYVEQLKIVYRYLEELREKYQFKQGEVYDEALWNNREKKDEIDLQRKIKESNESDERLRQLDKEYAKLSWKDRNKAIGVTCPTCGSSDRVYRISAAKKGFLAGLMGAASAGLQAKTFQCKNCGYKW